MASSVPKFASFRPKPKTTPAPSEEPRKTNQAEKPPKAKAPSPKRLGREKHLPSDKAYFSDRRGDPEVLRYGTLNGYDIPPYRRHGHGYVLGCSLDQKIDRENSTDKRVYITPATRRRQERLLTNKLANKLSDRGLRLVKAAEKQGGLDQDFITLASITKRKRSGSEDEGEGTPETDYRGFDQERNPSLPLDPDTQYESDAQVSGIDPVIARKTSELMRRTREHPEDVQGWLAFIEHQEAILKLDRPFAELTAVDTVHLADVRVAMYEEALKKIGKDQYSQIKLYEGLMKEARRAWDETKLAARWKEVLAKHPHSADLWFLYLDFVQTSFARFRYEECRLVFFNCLEGFRGHTTGIAQETTLHVLLRLTTMIQEAGYQELALAIWQALLEYHVMRPAIDASANSRDDFRAFEEFWESEVPRIGDPEAKGWKYRCADDAPLVGSPLLQEPDSSDSTFEHFRNREVEAIAKLRYPGRTSDEGGEDDAFHTIFFSDIEDYLKILPAGTPSTVIIEAFLCFCGLPSLARIAPLQQQWYSDPFLQRRFYPASHSQEGSSHFTQTLKKLSDCPLKSFQMTSELLFDQGSSLDTIRLSPDFVRRVLKLLASNIPRDDIVSEYLLAFELHHFPADVHKTAKQLLKAHPSSLRLYNAYGLVESRRDNPTKADQVLSMALSMQEKESPAFSMTGSLEVCKSWGWEALRRGEQTEALWRLASPYGSIPARPFGDLCSEKGKLLNGQSIFCATGQRALLSQDYALAVSSTSLHALSLYLYNDCDAEVALTVHHSLSAWFTSHKLSDSPYAELHAQSIARLLTYHVTHAPIVKPALLRTTLEPLVSLFPNNSILLSLYAANEARLSIDDRVRGIMRQTALHSPDSTSVSGWAFAIHYETLRGEIAGSTSHSIRALYKRATLSTGAHCPALWTSYLQFELAQLRREQAVRPDKKPRKGGKKSKREGRVAEAEQRAKETLYAGLRNLPWCKDFVMMAFTEASAVFGEEEKARVYRVMQEKELRLYTELDETHA